MSAVVQLPRRSQITFGGCPRTKLTWWKSEIRRRWHIRGPVRKPISRSRSPGPGPHPGRGRTPEKRPTGEGQGAGTDSRGKGASPGGNRNQPAFTLRRERQRSRDVRSLKVREICQDLLFRHPRREVHKDVVHRDPEPADAWLSAPLVRFNGDSIQVVHASTILRPDRRSNAARADRTFAATRLPVSVSSRDAAESRIQLARSA